MAIKSYATTLFWLLHGSSVDNGSTWGRVHKFESQCQRKKKVKSWFCWSRSSIGFEHLRKTSINWLFLLQLGVREIISGPPSPNCLASFQKGQETVGLHDRRAGTCSLPPPCSSGRSGKGTPFSKASSVHCQVFPSPAICPLSSLNKYLSGYMISVFVFQSNRKVPRPLARHQGAWRTQRNMPVKYWSYWWPWSSRKRGREENLMPSLICLLHKFISVHHQLPLETF